MNIATLQNEVAREPVRQVPPMLRPYQAEALDRLRDAYRQGARAPLFVLPTAGGKTVVFAAILAGAAAKGRRALVLVHRRELIRQASLKLAQAGVDHGFIAAGFAASNAPVRVASVQTLAHRLDALGDVALVVIDEAHHAVAATYQRVLAALPGTWLLGVTATPERLDGKGLGIAAGGCFDALVLGAGSAELTAGGFLAPCRVFAPRNPPDLSGVRTERGDYALGQLARAMDTAPITGDAVAHYARHAPGQPAIAFCVSIAHAEHVAAGFAAAGWRSAAVAGATPVRQRDALIAGLATGEIQVLTACDLISEGLDVPAVEAVILLRPTQSLAMFLQQVGRGMRPAPGKTRVIVLDHAGNCFRHGLPDDVRAWSLEGRPRQPREAAEPPTKTCFACGAVCALNARECPECGDLFPIRAPPPVSPDELREVERQAFRIRRIQSLPLWDLLTGRETAEQLREIARIRKYHPGWVAHRLREQTQAREIGDP